MAEPGQRIMNPPDPSSTRASLQFGLRALLIVTAGVSIFFGLVVAGWPLAAFGYVAGCGIGMMLADIAQSRGSRIWVAGLLLTGICYAAVNIAVLQVAWSIYHSAIFDPVYILSAAFVVPSLMIIAAIVLAARSRKLHWLAVLGFATWVACVGFAHLWVLGQISASC